MQTLRLKTIIGSLAVGLMLSGPLYAQMGPMTSMSPPGGNGSMMGGMMGNGTMRDMMPIHNLLMNHDQINRTVQDIPGGVRTTTTSKDPDIAKTIRTHVWQMRKRLTKNEPIRQGDPLFRQIFLHHNEINMQIAYISGGVQVMETSKNPQVALLIRQHARRAVSEFVKYGMPRVMQPTPLPKGYHPIGGKGGSETMGGMTMWPQPLPGRKSSRPPGIKQFDL